MFEKTFLQSLYRTNLIIIGLFFHGLCFPIWWLLSMSFAERSMSILAFIELATKSSVISSLFSSNQWTNIQFLLECCSWSSLSFSKVSALLFRVLTSSFELVIVSSFTYCNLLILDFYYISRLKVNQSRHQAMWGNPTLFQGAKPWKISWEKINIEIIN